MVSVSKEERSGRNFLFVLDKRRKNFLSDPLPWTVPVQYTAASLSHTLTNERLHVRAPKRDSALILIIMAAFFLYEKSVIISQKKDKRKSVKTWQGLRGGSLGNPAHR